MTLLAELSGIGWAAGIAAPVSASALDLDGLVQLEQSIKGLSRRLPDTPDLCAIVPSIIEQNTLAARELIASLKREYNGLVTTPARKYTVFREAPAAGETIFEYEPNSNGASDYEAITLEIIDHLNRQATAS